MALPAKQTTPPSARDIVPKPSCPARGNTLIIFPDKGVTDKGVLSQGNFCSPAKAIAYWVQRVMLIICLYPFYPSGARGLRKNITGHEG